jgi:hypothetical protein
LRDLLWFLLAVGLAEGWWADHRRVNVEAARWRLINERYQAGLHDVLRREAAAQAREQSAGDGEQEKSDVP